MAETTKIEWCDATFNPWIGCAKVSAGCENCYAERMMRRFPRFRNLWGWDAQRKRTSAANWKKPLAWDRKCAKEGRRMSVFCGSMCDVFEDRRDLDEWRRSMFRVIEKTPNLDWLLLTKRPWRIELRPFGVPDVECGWTVKNRVWLGTTVEHQETAWRHGYTDYPCAGRFLSLEPLLGPVTLPLYLCETSWVIVGGESGPNARPMHPDWVRSIRDQCAEAGVPFFFKGWGDKKRPALLDGKEHKEFPPALGG